MNQGRENDLLVIAKSASHSLCAQLHSNTQEAEAGRSYFEAGQCCVIKYSINFLKNILANSFQVITEPKQKLP